MYELTDSFLVATDIDRVWQFFCAVENLPKITPPWLNFTVTKSDGRPIQNDSIFDYTIRWSGIPVKWRTRIIDWNPPRQFVDLQTRGPYKLWHHTHAFESVEGGVRCRDRVLYELPFGPLGKITHAMIVRKQLLEIFRYRRTVIEKNLGKLTPLQDDVKIRNAD